jgi:hypothetical protein
MRRPISVTIEENNLLWLKAQAAATSRGNVSAVLDRLVAEARAEGRTDSNAVKSVCGTIDLPASDLDLEEASSYMRDVVDRSLGRPLDPARGKPLLAREEPPRGKRRPAKRRG